MSDEPNIDWSLDASNPDDIVLLGAGERQRIFGLWKDGEQDFVRALKARFKWDDFYEFLADSVYETEYLDDWFRRNVEPKDVCGTHNDYLEVRVLADRMEPSVLYDYHGGKGAALAKFKAAKMNVFINGVMPPINIFVKLLRQKFAGDELTLRNIELLSDMRLLNLYDEADTGFHWTMNMHGDMDATPRMLQDAVDLIDRNHIRAARHEPGWAEEQPGLSLDVASHGQLPLFRESAAAVVCSLLEAEGDEPSAERPEDIDWSHDPNDPDSSTAAHESAIEVAPTINMRR
jgi:hypothetical protein